MGEGAISFNEAFCALTGFQPMKWQERLYARLSKGDIPGAIDLPTGLGKTSVMAIWLIARALANEEVLGSIPRRLVYVVDRRAVVDQATEQAEKLRKALNCDAKHVKALRLGEDTLPISTLRGEHADNHEWLADPASPAIIVGTVDMIGSRLLFEGYGVTRKMRPYHAGLLGADTLLVLDEAHLVPPFAHLLAAIEAGEELQPKENGVVPFFRLLPLSATQRSGTGSRPAFRLEPDDIRQDDVAAERFQAKKRLWLERGVADGWSKALAEKAWELATADDRFSRVVVFCNRRDEADDQSSGPSVGGVLRVLKRIAKGDRKAGVPQMEFDCELLVGGRRVKERQDAAGKLKALGFIGRSDPFNSLAKPTFLLATSAGEVGVDFDADHMVSDLAPWERMVQRLGRVNRCGGKLREARVVVFDSSETEKDEDGQDRLKKTLGLLDAIGNGGQLSSEALTGLRNRVGDQMIADASTPEPLRPALTRALVDAWSMTSLEEHTGRPEIDPWLRGWIEEDEPQTRIVWRQFLPVIDDGQSASREDVERFFEAAPPHLTEVLETESRRAAGWLLKRADKVDPDAGRTIAFALNPDGSLRDKYSIRDLGNMDSDAKKQFAGKLASATLVVAATLAGVSNDGLLDPDESKPPATADGDGAWIGQASGPSIVGFRVRRSDTETAESIRGWRESLRLNIVHAEDGDAVPALVVEGLNEERRSESRNPQFLEDHQSWAEEDARRIASGIGLPAMYADALALAARLHDEGKRARVWQRAFSAPADGVYAKTKGPLRSRLLDGYRHEFGSIPFAERHPAFNEMKGQNPSLADLILHLIASHHGGARPLISTRACEDAPPSALDARARDVALRFARLQKEWGPWGLAWWEALLRAADQRASRRNDERNDSKTASGRVAV